MKALFDRQSKERVVMGERKKRKIVGLMLTNNISSLFIIQYSTIPPLQFLEEL